MPLLEGALCDTLLLSVGDLTRSSQSIIRTESTPDHAQTTQLCHKLTRDVSGGQAKAGNGDVSSTWQLTLHLNHLGVWNLGAKKCLVSA